MTAATDICKRAIEVMGERGKTYDKHGTAERSMTATVAAFNAITGQSLTEEQGWLFMVALKMVRSQQGDYQDDNYLDGTAYFALAGECAARVRGDAEADKLQPTLDETTEAAMRANFEPNLPPMPAESAPRFVELDGDRLAHALKKAANTKAKYFISLGLVGSKLPRLLQQMYRDAQLFKPHIFFRMYDKKLVRAFRDLGLAPRQYGKPDLPMPMPTAGSPYKQKIAKFLQDDQNHFATN